jgi:hypothetical protein
VRSGEVMGEIGSGSFIRQGSLSFLFFESMRQTAELTTWDDCHDAIRSLVLQETVHSGTKAK